MAHPDSTNCDNVRWVRPHEMKPCGCTVSGSKARTKSKHPHTNGIRERFHRTCLNEF
jgi:hypothetical protein